MSNSYDLQTFQGLILTLQDYWMRHGCMIAEPFDMEVGAGTSHPMTFLRSLDLNLYLVHMYNHQEDQLMVDMVKTLTDYSTIISSKLS